MSLFAKNIINATQTHTYLPLWCSSLNVTWPCCCLLLPAYNVKMMQMPDRKQQTQAKHKKKVKIIGSKLLITWKVTKLIAHKFAKVNQNEENCNEFCAATIIVAIFELLIALFFRFFHEKKLEVNFRFVWAKLTNNTTVATAAAMPATTTRSTLQNIFETKVCFCFLFLFAPSAYLLPVMIMPLLLATRVVRFLLWFKKKLKYY